MNESDSLLYRDGQFQFLSVDHPLTQRFHWHGSEQADSSAAPLSSSSSSSSSSCRSSSSEVSDPLSTESPAGEIFQGKCGADYLADQLGRVKYPRVSDWSPATFRAWAKRSIERDLPKRRRFQLLDAIRCLKRKHAAELQRLWELFDEAERAAAPELEQLKKLTSAQDSLKRSGARSASAVERLEQVTSQLNDLLAQPQVGRWKEASRNREQFQLEIGLTQLLADEKATTTKGGHAYNKAGLSFELASAHFFAKLCIPELPEVPAGRRRVLLSDVKVQSKRIQRQWDLVCVLVPEEEEEYSSVPVSVEAIIECKLRPDDIGEAMEAFTQVIDGLKVESAGHVFHHKKDGRTYSFDHSSFAHFQKTEGLYLERIYFTTAPRLVSNLSSSAAGILSLFLYGSSRFDFQTYEDPELDPLITEKIAQLPRTLDTTTVFRAYQEHGFASRILFIRNATVYPSELKPLH